MEKSLTNDNDVLEFMQLMFYDTLEQVFRIICKLEGVDPAQQEELRRLVLKPNDIRVVIKNE